MLEAIIKTLEYARLELLDMGLRGNTLLHFRQTAKTLEIVDEVSSEVLNIIVSQNKSMTFIPVPDSLVDDNDQVDNSQPLPALLEEMYGESRHTDTKLQTKLISDKLDKRLLRISTDASTYYQEQGVDILYLALGFLHWYEDKNSDKLRKAPLVLVPVSLERSTARERFMLKYTQTDIGSNLSLAAKMKMDFQIILPEIEGELDIINYLASVEQCISKQARWKVNVNEVSLGFFSFGKFQMYQDLDSASWPQEKQPAEHPILNALLGKGFSEESNGELVIDSDYDGSTPDLVNLHFVKDADSSQTDAVMAVKQGSNLVIQGPPGTGKSQTITNIISESLSDGKRVLFVAEKMAALEVVKRRLDECHLGDAVLELHSHKSNKKSVMEELKRTLELGAPAVEDRAVEKRRYTHLKEELDAYCHDVNTPILNSDTSYFDALGYYLQLKKMTSEVNLPVLEFDSMREWTKDDFNEACAKIKSLADHLESMGVPAENAFSDSSLEEFSPIEQEKLSTLLEKTKEFLVQGIKESNILANEMGLQAPVTLTDIQILHNAASRAMEAPHLVGLSLTTDDWQLRRDQIRELLKSGNKMSELKRKGAEQFIDQAWHADLIVTRQVWTTTGNSWWRFLSGEFRQAKRTLQGLLKSKLPNETTDCVALIDTVLQYQTHREMFEKHQRLGVSLFGAQWQDESSDWQVLTKLTDWVVKLYDEVGKGDLPKGVLRFLEGSNDLLDWAPRLTDLAGNSKKIEDQLEEVVSRLASKFFEQGDKSISETPLTSIIKSLQVWEVSLDDLYKMTRYNRICKQLNSPGLDQIRNFSHNWVLPPQLILSMLKINWYGGLVEEAYKQHKTLSQFDRVSHESIISEFKDMDKQLFHHAQESLVKKLHEQMPSASAAGEMAIIRREINKKRRHLAIRKLISQTGRAIQSIKPVFMMSPMSVATYLEQGSVDFDLVVFDEASQVKVVDALGPILRGKQVVVVGDTRQMPPTDFFGKAVELDDDEAEESQTADIESILSMFLSQATPEIMLRWHYRSRHDSLIAVSNQEFYEGKLMIFPSPGVNPEATGLKFRYLPDTIYERGGSRTNPGEAREIANAVIEHAKNKPNLTLGVAAFSTAQRDCILLEIERLRRSDSSCEDFFNTVRDDGEIFFVKNLENVQGDERDIIFISIAYGRTASGKISSSFGPINRDGGERRLNVLITRARLGMEVFCNFRADDLVTKATTPFGVRSLKNFLKYAETGELERPSETGKETDSPFEDEVITAIRSLGFEIEPQVGSAGFFIDIGVRDPKKPGRYILAVECDGASYHSSASARDRDRIRQDVLEGLGWRFHRVWSTDWFRNPYKETQRLKDAIELAVAYYDELDSGSVLEEVVSATAAVAPVRIKRDSSEVTQETKAENIYNVISGDIGIALDAEIHELDINVIQEAVNKIIKIEGPVHIKEAARRITESAGQSRVGSRILQCVKRAVDKGHHDKLFYLENEFIYCDEAKDTPVRDRSKLPAALKKIEFVPAEEMRNALIKVVTTSFSISRQDVISEALSLMGFQRSTEKSRSGIDKVIDGLMSNDIFKEEDGLISLN